MAAPVINATQSSLGYLERQTFAFQPYATNSPTGWSSSPLPPGLSLNSTTGLISGAVTAPGVYNVGLRAANADGASAPVVFCIAIEASAASGGSDIDLEWDLVSNEVTLAAGVPPQGVAAGAGLAPLLAAKYLSDPIFNVRLVKGGVTVDLTVTALHAVLKQTDDGPAIASSDVWVKSGSGETSRYRVHLPLSGDPLSGAIDFGGSDDVKSWADALAELEIVYTNPDRGTGSVLPASLRAASDTFLFRVTRNLAPA